LPLKLFGAEDKVSFFCNINCALHFLCISFKQFVIFNFSLNFWQVN